MNQIQLIIWCLLNGLTYGGWVSFLTDSMIVFQTPYTYQTIHANERFYLSTYLTAVLFICLQTPYCRIFQYQSNKKGPYHWRLSPFGLLLSLWMPLQQVFCTEVVLYMLGFRSICWLSRLQFSIPMAWIATCFLEHSGLHQSFRSWID